MEDAKISLLIIEDEEDSAREIRRTIKAWYKKCGKELEGFSLEFFEGFDLKNYSSHDQIIDTVLNLMIDGSVNAIVIDFKLDQTSAIINGAKLFRELANSAPRFPMIILTNRDEDCEETGEIDFDKIYKKIDFLKAGNEISDSLVRKLIVNVRNYIVEKSKLETKIEQLSKCDDSHSLNRLLDLEEIYGSMVPNYQVKTVLKALGNDFINKLSSHLSEAEDYLKRN